MKLPLVEKYPRRSLKFWEPQLQPRTTVACRNGPRTVNNSTLFAAVKTLPARRVEPSHRDHRYRPAPSTALQEGCTPSQRGDADRSDAGRHISASPVTLAPDRGRHPQQPSPAPPTGWTRAAAGARDVAEEPPPAARRYRGGRWHSSRTAARSDRVHGAGPDRLRCASQPDERDARNQRGGDHPRMQPATQPRLDRIHQVDSLLHQSSDQMTTLRSLVTLRFAGQSDIAALSTP